MVVAVLSGGACGYVFGPAMGSIAWLGELFLTALKMVIVPLVVASVVTGIASLGDVRRLGKIGWLTVSYYLVTTFIAVTIGLLMANVWQPGAGVSLEGSEPVRLAGTDLTGADLILSLLHPNIVEAAAQMKLLPLIVFSILFGAAMSQIGESGKTVTAFFEGLNEIVLRIVHWVMYMAPLGVFALIASRLGSAGGGEAFLAQLGGLGKYVLTVLSGLALHVGMLSLILVILGARRVLAYLSHLAPALVTAFSTASSSATLPVTMEGTRNAGVPVHARRFVLPLGATVNMDGTALYEAVAAMFIAQAYGVDLSFMQQCLVLLTATLAAIGAAGIPEAGLVTMVIVLDAVGLPLEGIGLILAIDWFLDRCRTTVNVYGDAVGAAVVGRLTTR